MHIGKRHVLYLSVYFLCLTICVAFLYRVLRSHMSLAGQQNQFLPFLIALVVPFLLSAGAIVLKPVREFLEAWVGRDLDSTTCRIYFFGCRGSGKTAMIKNILASGEIT